MLSTYGLVLSKREKNTHLPPPRNTTRQFWLGWSSSSFHVFICWWNACHAYVPEMFAVCMLKTGGSGHVKLRHHSASWSVNFHWNAFANSTFQKRTQIWTQIERGSIFVRCDHRILCMFVSHVFFIMCQSVFQYSCGWSICETITFPQVFYNWFVC